VPTFSSVLSDDVDDVFLEKLEYAEDVTYRVASTSATGTITLVAEPQIFAILDNKQNAKFTISLAQLLAVLTVAPERGDQVTQGGVTWTVLDIQDVVGMAELRCLAPLERS